MGGGGGGGGPTPQQKQLETNQAVSNATLNNEENLQRKTILNAMQGTRVFRGSALSRALAGNTPGSASMNPAPGPAVPSGSGSFIGGRTQKSLLDNMAPGSGATAAGGAGASNPGTAPIGGYAGGFGGGGASRAGAPKP